MPTAAVASSSVIIAAVWLSLLIFLVWIFQLALFTHVSGSDAAGDAMANGFAVLATIVVWVLLSVLAIIAVTKGKVPGFASLAALVLIPASGFVSGAALDLLTQPRLPPFMWPVIIPAVVPPLVVLFCFWALVPSFHDAVRAPVAGGVVWGVTLVLCLAIIPMAGMRQQIQNQRNAARADVEARFAKLPADAPLWDVTPFLGTNVNDEALDRIRHSDRRQGDAETMLERGDFPLLYLRNLDLDPTPALCDKARAELRRRVEPLVLTTPNSRDYAEIADEMAGAASSMEWLVGYDCSCDAESRAWEQMAKGYRGNNFDFYRVVHVRDPEALGHVLLNYPEKFSMLTPRAHLRAWLKFADDKDLREQALAGARKLDHRTSDAVEILGEEYGAGTIFRYLPDLDLEPNPAFCAAALGVVQKKLANPSLRPRSDYPSPYEYFPEGVNGSLSLQALIWLAEHGCNAEAELTQAESLVNAYQDSPSRPAMLRRLAELHHRT